LSDFDTIAAISTPIGEGGIGIVRISGPEAFAIGKRVFTPRRQEGPGYPRSHYLYYGHVLSAEGEVIDEVLAAFMKAPRTYTREDIVEINCHSGVLTLRKVLNRVLEAGARLAQPGEFTRRAFLNGRIDLSQAESIMRIIRARSEEALRIGLSNLQGRLSREIGTIREKILTALSRIEARLDFPEDVDDELDLEREVKPELAEVAAMLSRLAAGAGRGHALQEGIYTAIIGKPNAGKSSLLNALLREERAIVHEIPGTTRDLLEGYLTVKGYPLCLADTAGIHRTDDPVEQKGIARAKAAVERARLLILVLDGSTGWSREDEEVAELIRPGQAVVIVINKIDLPQRLKPEEVRARLPGHPVVCTSAVHNLGLDQLEEAIGSLLDEKLGGREAESPAMVSLRHAGIVQEALALVQSVLEALSRQPLELLSMDLKEAWLKLGEITGETVSEELLDRIFSEFCIGK